MGACTPHLVPGRLFDIHLGSRAMSHYFVPDNEASTFYRACLHSSGHDGSRPGIASEFPLRISA